MWINSLWKIGDVSCILWSLSERMLRSRAPNTHWRRKLSTADCVAPFCYYSIIEGHSFTITVGLWVSADIMNTVTLWPVAEESRQESLLTQVFSSQVDSDFSELFFSLIHWLKNRPPFLQGESACSHCSGLPQSPLYPLYLEMKKHNSQAYMEHIQTNKLSSVEPLKS